MSDEKDDLFSAFKTTLEMIEDRGYYVSKQTNP